MSRYEYDWSREWREAPPSGISRKTNVSVQVVDSVAPNSADEEDVEATFSPAYAHPLAEHDDRGLLTLLGSAGAGKSYELVRLERVVSEVGRAVERVRVRDMGDGYSLAERALSSEVISALDQGETAYVLIDALDETGDPHVLDRLVTEIKKLEADTRARLRLRVTCRSSYHSANLDLKSYLARLGRLLEPALTLELRNLSPQDVALAASARNEDPERFWERVRARHVEALTEVPSTLNLLLDLYAEEKDLPTTRLDVFEKGIALRLSPPYRKNALDWPIERVMDGAGAVAALLLIARKTFVLANRSVSIGSGPAIPLHTVRKLAALDGVSESDLAKFFHTELFDGALGEHSLAGAVEIGSKEFAEFLAARYLARPPRGSDRAPSREDLLALLAVSEDPRRGVRPDLLEVAGWAATFAPDALFDHLLETDPHSLLFGDPASQSVSPERRERLVHEITRAVREYRISPFDLKRMGLEGVGYPGINEHARDLLRDEDPFPVILGLALYAAGPLDCLTVEVASVALDCGTPIHVRKLAVAALREARAKTDILLRLIPLLSDDEGDPFFSLRDEVAETLYPRAISAEDLLSALSFPERRPFPERGRQDDKVDFGFTYFLGHELPDRLDAIGIAAAFRRTAPLVRNRDRWNINRSVLGFVDALLVRASHLNGLGDGSTKSKPDDVFNIHLLAWMRRNDHSMHGAFADVWRSSEALRMHALELLAGEGESDHWAPFFGDHARISERVRNVPVQQRDAYFRVIWWITQNLEAAPTRRELVDDDGFRAFAASKLGLPSNATKKMVTNALTDLETRWRKDGATTARRRAREANHEPVRKEPNPNRAVLGAKDWQEVWQMIYQERLNEPNSDWTAFPGWDSLPEKTKRQAFELAHRFVTQHPEGLASAGSWREARRTGGVLAAHAALRLLCEHERAPSGTKWLPTQVALALTSPMVSRRWTKFALASWDRDPVLSVRVALHVVGQIDETRWTDRAALLAFVRHDSSLLQALAHVICREDFDSKATGLIAGVLIEVGGNVPDAPVTAIFKRSVMPGRVAACAAEVLASKVDYPELWFRLADDDRVSVILLSRLADRQFQHEDEPIRVTPEQRCDLIDRAIYLFPRSRLPDRPLSGGYTPTTTDNVQYWIGNQASALIDEGEYSVLERLVQKHPTYGYLAHRAWVKWRTLISNSRVVQTSELVSQINNLRLRVVRTPGDLLQAVLEALGRYQKWLDAGAVYDIWNVVRPTLLDLPAKEGKNKLPMIVFPRREEPCSDHLARFLALDLPHVLVRREVRTPKQGRTDVEVTVTDSEGREVKTIVEVKGSYHEAATEIESQLIKRYLAGTESTGVHVVFDLWTPKWSSMDYAKSKAERMTGTTLKEDLEAALGAVSMRSRVEAVIVRAGYH